VRIVMETVPKLYVHVVLYVVPIIQLPIIRVIKPVEIRYISKSMIQVGNMTFCEKITIHYRCHRKMMIKNTITCNGKKILA
jgi:predicted lipase